MSVIHEPSEFNRGDGVPKKPLQGARTSGARVKTRLVRRTLPGHFEENALERPEGPDQAHPYGSVTVIGGPGRGTSFDLAEKFMRIGRDPSQEIHLPQDDAVSRECHAIIGFNQDLQRFTIFDGGKANPVWVNAEEIKDAVILENEDIIRIGQTVLCLTYY